MSKVEFKNFLLNYMEIFDDNLKKIFYFKFMIDFIYKYKIKIEIK